MPTPRRTLTIAPTPLQGGHRQNTLTPEAAGVGVAEAQTRAGLRTAAVGDELANTGLRLYSAVEKQKAEAKEQADQLAIVKMQNEMDVWRRTHVYDPHNGYLTKKGEDALGLPEQAQKDFEAFASGLGPMAQGPKQQLAWERIQADGLDRTMLEVYRHEADQTSIITKAALDARLDNATKLAMANALDPKRVAVELGNAEAALDAIGAQAGLDKTAKEQAKAKLRANIHEGVIRNLVANEKTMQARAYFEETRKEIAAGAGDRMDEIQNLLRAGSVKSDAQRESDRILKEGGTLAEQREKAKQITDPDVRDQALAYVEHERTVQEAEQRANEHARSKRLADLVDKTHSIKTIPAADWHDMDKEERASWRAYAKSLIEAGGVTKTDQRTYYGLLQLAKDDPTEFVTKDLYAIGTLGKVTPSDFQELARLQLSMQQGQTKAAEAALDGPIGFLTTFNSKVQAIGIKTGTAASTNDKKRYDALLDSVRTTISAEQARTGKKLSSDEEAAIIDRKLIDVVVEKGRIWDTKVKGYQMTIDRVPQAEKPAIIEALKRKHYAITEANIIDAYLKALQLEQERAK